MGKANRTSTTDICVESAVHPRRRMISSGPRQILVANIVGLLLLSLFFPLNASAQISNNVGTSGFQFLKIGVGASETALAGAGTAIANGPDALFWNVAGITRSERTSVMFFYDPWIASIKQDYVAASVPVGTDDYIGLSANYVSLGQMDETTIDQPQGTGRSFTAGDFAVGFSYARRISQWVSAGLTAKYVNERIWDMVSDGWAFDLGLSYENGSFHLGMVIKDFGTKKDISGSNLESLQQIYPDWQTSSVRVGLVPRPVSLPTSFAAGVAYDFLKSDFNRLSILGNLAYFNDIGQTFNVGGEYSFLGMYSLRMGYKFDTDIYGMTFGAGIKAPIAGTETGFDLAAIQMKDFGYRTQFDVSIAF